MNVNIPLIKMQKQRRKEIQIQNKLKNAVADQKHLIV